jgi:adenylyl cyclase-associated protein
MDEKLIQRLESAVSRLESISTGFHPATSPSDGSDAAADPSIVAYGDLVDQFVGRVSSAAEIIGGQVLEVTNRVKDAFAVQKELLIKLKTTQVDFILVLD